MAALGGQISSGTRSPFGGTSVSSTSIGGKLGLGGAMNTGGIAELGGALPTGGSKMLLTGGTLTTGGMFATGGRVVLGSGGCCALIAACRPGDSQIGGPDACPTGRSCYQQFQPCCGVKEVWCVVGGFGTGGAGGGTGFTSNGGTSAAGGAPVTGGVVGTGGTSSPSSACIVRAMNTGNDNHDGSSWSQAFGSVQAAIDQAFIKRQILGVDVCEVWVAQGTYFPTKDVTGSDSPSDPRTVTIQLQPNIALYGGFLGDETGRDQRDFVSHESILSGDLGTHGDASDNAYSVVTGAGNAIMDGLTITGGNANGTSQVGGGGLKNNGMSLRVTNCTFSSNNAMFGGGISNDGASVVIANCAFSGNSATFGGAIWNGGSSTSIDSCVLSGNSAGSGGGISDNSVYTTVSNCSFDGNTAVQGGAIDLQHSSSAINGSNFSKNSASVYGGAISSSNASSPQIADCAFDHNSAQTGGAMYNGSGATVINCSLSSNLASLLGGGIYSVSGWTLTNSILWGNIGGNIESAPSVVPLAHVSYSDIEGGCTTQMSCTYDNTGNINADPLFVDAASGNLQLTATSPCIDKGNSSVAPLLDLRGNPRVDIPGVGNEVRNYADMGAYEIQP